ALIALGEGGGLRFSPGAFWIVLAAFSTSLYFVFQKPLHGRYTPLEVTAYTLWAGTLWMLPLLPGLPAELAAAPPAATWSVVYLGVGPGALAYVAWTFALSRAPASRVTSFLYLSPALAIVIAWVWLGEWPSLLAVVGGAVAIVGVLVTQYAGRAPASRGIS
ncbi:DMT family transporter, partial [Oceanithermus sp.]